MLQVVKPNGKKPNKRFLLINPPIEEPYRIYTDDQQHSEIPRLSGRFYTFPLPIGLLRIAEQLVANGNEVYFLDCFSSLEISYPCSRARKTKSDEVEFELTNNYRVKYLHLGMRYNEISRFLEDLRIDEIYVGCTFTYHNEPAHKVIELCREKMGDIKITFGGIYPTLAPEIAQTSQADEIFTGAYPEIESQKLNYDFLGTPPGFILIKGTSGCPNSCAYCAVHLLEGNRFTHRDPGEVFDEILSMHKRYNLTQVGMWDSNILIKYSDYLGAILDRIHYENLKLQLSAPEGFDYRLLTADIAKTLKIVNFRKIHLALENSDNNYTKSTLNRANDLQQLEKAVEYLKSAGFQGHQIILFIIVGLPNQSIESVCENIQHAWRLGCNVTLFPFTPIPNTQLYDSCLSQIQHLPLKALHPSLYSCVDNEDTIDMLIDLSALEICSRDNCLQRDNLSKVITNSTLLELLST